MFQFFGDESDLERDVRLEMGPTKERVAQKEYINPRVPEDNFDRFKKALNKIEDVLTRNIHGLLYDGDVVRLKWVGDPRQFLWLSALPADVDELGQYAAPCRVTAIDDHRTLLRSSFHVFRSDVRIPSTVPLRTDECIFLSTTLPHGTFFLFSELQSGEKYAALSMHQDVEWAQEKTGNVLWKAMPLQCTPSEYIQTNVTVALNHILTNQYLAVEQGQTIRSAVGLEHEVTAHTYHKNPGRRSREIEEENHWQFDGPYDTWMMTHPRKCRPMPSFDAICLSEDKNMSAREKKRFDDITRCFDRLVEVKEPSLSAWQRRL